MRLNEVKPVIIYFYMNSFQPFHNLPLLCKSSGSCDENVLFLQLVFHLETSVFTSFTKIPLCDFCISEA